MTDLDAIAKRIIDENTTPGEVQPEPDYQPIIAKQIAKEAGISYGQAHVAMMKEIAHRITSIYPWKSKYLQKSNQILDEIVAELSECYVLADTNVAKAPRILTLGDLARRIDGLETALSAVLRLGADLSGKDYEKYQEVVMAREVLARKV